MRVTIIAALFGLFAVTSCKKLVEDTKKNYVLDVMTQGQWYIESLKEGDADKTPLFNGYLFEFEEDGSLLSYKGALVETGTWVGDITNYTITTSFPNATEPLVRLNGIWVLKDSMEDYVLAEKDSGPDKKVLKLRKKP